MMLDGVRAYAQLAAGITEVARERAAATVRALLEQRGLVSADELARANERAERLERRVRELELALAEGTAAAQPAKRAPAKRTAATKESPPSRPQGDALLENAPGLEP